MQAEHPVVVVRSLMLLDNDEVDVSEVACALLPGHRRTHMSGMVLKATVPEARDQTTKSVICAQQLCHELSQRGAGWSLQRDLNDQAWDIHVNLTSKTTGDGAALGVGVTCALLALALGRTLECKAIFIGMMSVYRKVKGLTGLTAADLLEVVRKGFERVYAAEASCPALESFKAELLEQRGAREGNDDDSRRLRRLEIVALPDLFDDRAVDVCAALWPNNS